MDLSVALPMDLKVDLLMDPSVALLSEALHSAEAPHLRRMAPLLLHLTRTVLLPTVDPLTVDLLTDLSEARPTEDHSEALPTDRSEDLPKEDLSGALLMAHPLSVDRRSEAAAVDTAAAHLPATELPQCQRPFPRSTRPTVDTHKLIYFELDNDTQRPSSRVNIHFVTTTTFCISILTE